MAIVDDDRSGARNFGHVALTLLLGVGVLFATGVVIGIFAGHADKGGGPMSPTLIAILAGTAAIGVACAYGCYRKVRGAVAAGGLATPRERRNMITLLVSGLIGGLLAVGMILGGDSSSAFSNTPIAPAAAVAMALVIGIVLPALSLYWHLRVVDEQEAAAYRTGALLALYAFWIGAPVWWLLWRGGLVPAPDGIALYMITIVIAGAVWLWGKYR